MVLQIRRAQWGMPRTPPHALRLALSSRGLGQTPRLNRQDLVSNPDNSVDVLPCSNLRSCNLLPDRMGIIKPDRETERGLTVMKC